MFVFYFYSKSFFKRNLKLFYVYVCIIINYGCWITLNICSIADNIGASTIVTFGCTVILLEEFLVDWNPFMSFDVWGGEIEFWTSEKVDWTRKEFDADEKKIGGCATLSCCLIEFFVVEPVTKLKTLQWI